MSTVDTIIGKLYSDDVPWEAVGHEALERNQVYRLNDQGQILKLYGNQKRWEQELTFLRLPRDERIVIPDLIDSGCDEGVHWVLMSEVCGRVLSDVMEGLSPTDYNDMLHQVGAYQATLHRAYPTEIASSDYRRFIIERHDRYAQHLLSEEGHDHGFFQRCYERMKTLEHCLDYCTMFSYCHNDYGPRNIMVEQGDRWRITGLIDFEHCFPADPEYDMTCMLVELYNRSGLEHYIKGYQSERQLSSSFDDKITYYMLCKCSEICSWSRLKAPDYYDQAKACMMNIICK